MSKEVEILLSSMNWIKDKESNPDTVKETGLIVDEVLDWLAIAKDRKIGIMNVLRDVFMVSANEADGSLRADMFELFVTVQKIIETRKDLNESH